MTESAHVTTEHVIESTRAAEIGQALLAAGIGEDEARRQQQYAQTDRIAEVRSAYTQVLETHKVAALAARTAIDAELQVIEHTSQLASAFHRQHVRSHVDQLLGQISAEQPAPPDIRSDDITVLQGYITTRTYNCLKREGYNTFGDLVAASAAELRCIRNFGARGLTEITTLLEVFGLTLWDTKEPRPESDRQKREDAISRRLEDDAIY